MNSVIKSRLAKGNLVRVMFFGSLANPKFVEIAGLSGGLDGVWFDQEHSAIPHHELELLLMACRACGLDAFVRVAPTDYTAIMRPMETGASGVMAAQIRTLAQVREIVGWAKYPPLGVRGLFGANYEAGYGAVPADEHVKACNANRWLAIQIETPEAVDIAREIAATEGVDHLFVGPADLACTLGVPGEVMHPRCIAALERVSVACKAAGKSWGVLARSPEHAAKCLQLGCQLFSFTGDFDVVARGLAAAKAAFPDLLSRP